MSPNADFSQRTAFSEKAEIGFLQKRGWKGKMGRKKGVQ